MRHDGRNQDRADELETDESLLRRLEPLVRSVVARFARDGATADELVQACRIRLYEKRKQCRDPEALFGWAKRLCQRVCLTSAGDKRRDRDRFVEDEQGVVAAETSVPDPLAAAETGEMCLRVRSAVERLPAEQQRLLTLRYWYGLSTADIARCLELPAGTVRTKLRRARIRLQRAPEIICYAPRRPSLWTEGPEHTTMDQSRNGSPSAYSAGAP